MGHFDEKTGRHYLEKGDRVEANPVTLQYTGEGYELWDICNADLDLWGDVEDRGYRIYYAYDLPKSDKFYGKPYYQK